MPVQVTRGALVAHQFIYAPPHCRTLQFRRTFILLSVPSGMILLTLYLMVSWCGIGLFQEQGQCFFIFLSSSIPTIVFYYFSLSLLSIYMLVLWGWGLQTDRVYITFSQPCTAYFFYNNNNKVGVSFTSTYLLASERRVMT